MACLLIFHLPMHSVILRKVRLHCGAGMGQIFQTCTSSSRAAVAIYLLSFTRACLGLCSTKTHARLCDPSRSYDNCHKVVKLFPKRQIHLNIFRRRLSCFYRPAYLCFGSKVACFPGKISVHIRKLLNFHVSVSQKNIYLG